MISLNGQPNSKRRIIVKKNCKGLIFSLPASEETALLHHTENRRFRLRKWVQVTIFSRNGLWMENCGCSSVEICGPTAVTA